MAASITAHLQIFKRPQLLRFSTDLGETGIKIHGLLRSFTCTDPGIFIRGRGGPGQSDKKALTFFVFFSPQLILLKSNGSRGGPTFSRRGGVQPFPGGGGGGPIANSL